MDSDLFGGSMDLGVVFRNTCRDDIGETKEGRAEGSSMLVNEGCAVWINIAFDLFGSVVLRKTLCETKKGMGDGSSVFALPINMDLDLEGGVLGVFFKTVRDGETKEEISITGFDLLGSLLRKDACENLCRDEGGEQKEGMDFSKRREVWR
jgi:hypothetical protein